MTFQSKATMLDIFQGSDNDRLLIDENAFFRWIWNQQQIYIMG